MKRKGQIVLVAMLALIFLAGTAYADDGKWWKRGTKAMWKQLFKVKQQANWNGSRIAKLEKKYKQKKKGWKYHHKKKKRAKKKNATPAIDMAALAKLVAAEMQNNPAVMAELKGEKGDPGEPGPAGLNATVLGRYLTLTTWDPTNPMDLQNAQLKNAVLLDNYMNYSDLSKANLSGAKLNNTDFSGATLSEADLRGAKVSGCLFTGADLTGANLEGVDMEVASGWETAIWGNTICPDGTNSDDNGLTCVGHTPVQ